jgi:CelD/BcsL family acetyltransferase involved in cellulose biosynthesis
MMASGPMSVLEVIHTEAGFDEIREEWTDLLAHSSSDCIFLTWEWLRTWWKHLSGSRKLHVLVVRRAGQVIAIAPFASPSTILIRLAGIRALEFLGTGSVGSDYLDIIARRGNEDDAAAALADYFRRQKFLIDLKGLPEERSVAGKLATLLQPQRWAASKVRTGICPFIDLAGHTWESFQAGLGGKHRYNFHRRLKNLHRDFVARFDCVVAEEQRSAALLTLVTLHNKRMQDRGGSDGLHSSELVGFHEELSRLALKRGWLRLFVLTLNGDKAAALYGFAYARKFYFYQSGFDPRYYTHSVGLVTMGLTIQAAIEGGSEEFDLLHGDEKYKSLWARQHRDLVRLELYPPTLRAGVYSRATRLNRLARRSIRRSLAMLGPRERSEPALVRLPPKVWSEAK